MNFRFVDQKTGMPVEFPDSSISAEDVFVGNVLSVKTEKGKHTYVVSSVEGIPEEPVRLVPATSNLARVFLLVAALTAAWFLLDRIFSLW